MSKDVMTPEEIRELRLRLELSQRDFGYMLQVDTTTVNRWEKGRAKPSRIYVSMMRRALTNQLRRESYRKGKS